jgi:oxygen-dependent protoporphyrinogen oxidase
MSAPRRIAVVGGGMAGLAAAHRVVESARAEGTPVDVVLLESAAKLGGTIATERKGGFTIEGGPDSILTEKPWAVALSERIGFSDRLVGTREGERRTYVAYDRELQPLPDGFLLLAPTDMWALARSPLFSWRGKLRMALDLVLPRRRATDDESLAHFVRRRLGREALERVAQPLIAGIYTGDAERLSLEATMPRFRDLERRHRSLILGLRAAARGAARGAAVAGARYGLFVAPRDGMGALVDALARRLPEGAIRLRAPVEGLALEGGTWRLRAGGEALAADGLVVATPAWAASTLLAPVDAALARALGAIEYSSSATVTIAYRSADLPELRGFGFVVPAVERRTMIACTYVSRKFPGRAPEGYDLVRGFLGGALRPDILKESDAQLLTVVQSELFQIVGIRARPELVRVHRYERAMPQYDVGHLARVAAIEARAVALPGLGLAGAAYRGVGIPDCVRSGEAAADALLGTARAG